MSDEWLLRAACRNAPDPSLWFPERGEDSSEAKAICAGCPVKAECLDYALKHRIHEGIWGATSERVRRKMRSSVAVVKACRFCGDRFNDVGRDFYCSDGCRRMAKNQSSIDSYHRRKTA